MAYDSQEKDQNGRVYMSEATYEEPEYTSEENDRQVPSSGSGMKLFLYLLLIGILFVIFAPEKYRFWGNIELFNSNNNQQLEQLDNTIEQHSELLKTLEKKIFQLEGIEQDNSSVLASIEALDYKVETLQKDLTTTKEQLSKQPAPAVQAPLVNPINQADTRTNEEPSTTNQSKVDTLHQEKLVEEHLKNLEKTQHLEEELSDLKNLQWKEQQTSQSNMLVVKVMLLREKVLTGAAFKDEIKEVSKLTAKDPHIQTMLQMLEQAADGIVLQKELLLSFKELITPLLKKHVELKKENSIQDRVEYYLHQLISVQKVGSTNIKGKTAPDYIARTEAYLRESKLKEALDEIEKLPDAYDDVLKDWRSTAQSSHKTKQLIDDLFEYTNRSMETFSSSPEGEEL